MMYVRGEDTPNTARKESFFFLDSIEDGCLCVCVCIRRLTPPSPPFETRERKSFIYFFVKFFFFFFLVGIAVLLFLYARPGAFSMSDACKHLFDGKGKGKKGPKKGQGRRD